MAITEQTKEVLKKRQELKKQEAMLFQKLFDSSDGKKVLKKVSQMCNEDEPTYVDQNPNGSAYKEGQRSIILGIRKMLNKTFETKQGSATI